MTDEINALEEKEQTAAYLIVKLITGEELVCTASLDKETDTCMLIQPLELKLVPSKHNRKKLDYIFAPYIPAATYEILPIKNQHILTMVPVQEDLAVAYKDTIQKINSSLILPNENNKIIH